VSLASNSTSICTVSGFVITAVAAGTCSLTATQGGDATYAPAAPMTLTFVVAVTLISPSATSGESSENSSFTAITMTPTGFTGTLTYVSTPPLPTGLTINSTTGEITGTPRTAKSTTPYTIKATSGLQTATAIVTITVTAGTCATSAGNVNTCFVGNTGPGGGIVFYVKEANATGSRYLEAAPNTWKGGVQDPTMKWWNAQVNVATQLGIGTGSANTTAIIALSATADRAATAARAYRGGGLNNWFLPSRDELNQLYLQRTVVGVFGTYFYWSSSQWDLNYAWVQAFSSSTQSINNKYDILYVRPVRAF